MTRQQDIDGMLLGPSDPDPVLCHGEGRQSPFLLVCDHAGNAIPRRLMSLGLSEESLAAHIAWDINAWHLSKAVADELAAPAIGQAYSRLVIDSNRRAEAADSIAVTSDGVGIPGNAGCSQRERQQRFTMILQPYQNRIAATLNNMRSNGAAYIVSMHTFTPRLAGGAPRPWHIGVISGPDDRMRRSVFHYLEGAGSPFVVGENVPYIVNLDSDYTLPVHAEANGIPYVELEIRNDMFHNQASCRAVCRLISEALRHALQTLGGAPAGFALPAAGESA